MPDVPRLKLALADNLEPIERGQISNVEIRRYEEDEFDKSSWESKGDLLCSYRNGVIEELNSCYDQKTTNCDHDTIPLKKGTFYYVIAVHTKKNSYPGDVFLFNVGYRRGEMALEECGDNFWEVHRTTLILIISVLSAILLTSLIFLAVMKRGKCCDIFIKPNQQKQHWEKKISMKQMWMDE